MPQLPNFTIRPRILALLRTERMTTNEIAARVGMAVNTTTRYLRELRAAGKAHECERRLCGRVWRSVWAPGPGDGTKPNRVRITEPQTASVPALCTVMGAVVRDHAIPHWAIRTVAGVWHQHDEAADFAS